MAAGAAASVLGSMFKSKKPKREVEAQELVARAEFAIQELDARLLPLLAAGAAASVVGSMFKSKKPKRESSDDLLSRGLQDWNKWAESVRNQAS